MSPTIITKDGKPVLILGTPGGSRIITTVLQTILNVVDFQMNIQEAVDAPRIHHQWLPDVTKIEPYALSPDTRRILEGMGYRFEEFGAGQPRSGDHGRCAESWGNAGRLETDSTVRTIRVPAPD